MRSVELRTYASRILDGAGIAPSLELFQDVRMSCATDPAQTRPQHVPTEWMMHTVDIACVFYRRTTDQDYTCGIDDAFECEQQRAAIGDDQALARQRIRSAAQ